VTDPSATGPLAGTLVGNDAQWRATAGRQRHGAPPLLGQPDEEILSWLEEGNGR
jgi:hypothetical protein